MKTAIATICLNGGPDEKRLAVAGFKGVEIFESDLLSFNGTPKDVRHAAQDVCIDTVTLQPFRNFVRTERKFHMVHEPGRNHTGFGGPNASIRLAAQTRLAQPAD